jgi:integrase
MPKVVKPLTDTQVRTAKPGGPTLYDGGGLRLLARNGKRHWRYRYVRPDGREGNIALGPYPALSLRDARALRDAARRQLAFGTDPTAARAAQKAEARRAATETFGRYAEEWLTLKSSGWAQSTRERNNHAVHEYLIPKLGKHSVRDLTSAEVVHVLRGMFVNSPALTRKAAQASQAIIRLAITDGAREDGRTLDLNLRDNLPAVEQGHNPAATTPANMRDVLQAIDHYQSPVTRAALLTCAYTGQRPGNVVTMRWDEVTDDYSEWHIAAAKMKTRHDHMVPLPEQVRDLLQAMARLTAGHEFVVPPLARQNTPHLHGDALSKALREMGLRGKQTPHGLRASLRTLARERLGVAADVLEAQLAHAKKGQVAAAYDRTQFNEERQHAMQQWADYLDKLRRGKS